MDTILIDINESKYITIENDRIKVNFISQKDAEDYIEAKGLYFKKDIKEEVNLEKTNKRIEGALNFIKNYQPTKVSDRLIPKEIKDKLISKVVNLSNPNRKKGKEGTACHIALNHQEGCEKEFLKDTMDTISNPINSIIYFTTAPSGCPRVVIYKRVSREDTKHKKVIVLDFLRQKNGYYRIDMFHNYRCKATKVEKEKLDEIDKKNI